MGAVSSAIILYMVLYVLLLLFSFSKTWVLYLSMLLFVFTDIALIVDFFIYKLFHFHINAMVLNILTSPDAVDSIQAGILPFILSIVLIIGFIFLELKLLNSIKKRNDTYKIALNSKINKLITIPFILIIFTEKISFGLATLFSKNQLIIPFKVIPLYQPLTFNKIASKYFGFSAEKQAQFSLKTNSDLNYPLQPLILDNRQIDFPIFIIASDSVKYDIINQELTPNIMNFANDALVFKHHYSGGNSTRFGIFSLIYGLNATYWFSFLNSNQKPVLFDILQKRAYDISIFSSTDTNWPEFRKTCYVNIQNKITDKFEGAPWKKDEQSTSCFIENISNKNIRQKHFSFIFLDSPHGYSYPPDANTYNATNGEVNYLAITKESQELQTVEKRYKNAVHYNDKLFGKIISSLKKNKLYDNALIIYTSDHGQEFFEQGNFGHNTAFSKPQIHIPLLIKLPKSLQGIVDTSQINSSLTSHQDIVPTLLTLLGVQNNPTEYSNGYNLFSKDFHRDYIFSANWNNNAIVTKETISVFSNLPNKIFNNEVRDSKTYKKSNNKKIQSKYILDIIQENKKFLK
jgi:membrane-anchored protein YejM (alkaline phosphatase superfamily)